MDVLLVVANGRQQVRHMVVVQRVVDVPPAAAPPHEPQRAQDPQVVGRRAQGELGGCRKTLNCAFSCKQFGKQSQARGRSKRLERLGQVGCLVGAE